MNKANTGNSYDNAVGISGDALGEALLAELRAGILRCKLAALDLQVAGVAVKHGLVSAEQAMEELNGRDALGWLFQDKEGGPS